MYAKEQYRLWLQKALLPSIADELRSIEEDSDTIADRFYRNMEFGTGGLRGEIGAGTNRMNLYTVGKATQGLAEYLLSQGEESSAVIAYDTRNMSREFAHHAAGVLCANGIRTYLFTDVRPTPMLSFAVRHLGAQAGIVITASHNPKQYNGYKVYGANGGQITDAAAAAILARIDDVDIFEDVKYADAKEDGHLHWIGEEVDRAYYARVKTLVLRKKMLQEKAGELKILYSPLYGCGNKPVRRVLDELGFSQVDVVPEQEAPDGDFPTAPYPNPEEPSVFALAIQKAKRTNPDLIFATDPDCDRIGVLCKTTRGDFRVLSGNQTGVLLCDYILKTKKELDVLPGNAAIVKTIVTTQMADAICREYGVFVQNVLTGFKYIGETVEKWAENDEYSFLYGFEESCGYLSGDFVRDKDAVIASVLIAEMALYYKECGLTLYEALEALYREYGYYCESLVSFSMPGKDGQEKIFALIDGLRLHWRDRLVGQGLAYLEDYESLTRINAKSGKCEVIDLPRSNVLKFIFEDGGWLVLRPSGTEPKMKLYAGARARDNEAAQARLSQLLALGEGWA